MEKLVLSIFMIFIILLVMAFLSWKYKLKKEQILIFWLLVLFWTSVSSIRAFRKVYASSGLEIGGLGLSNILAIKIASAYGLSSFLCRFPIFIFSDILKKRKIFIQISMFLVFLTSFLVFKTPNYETLYYSSLIMGLSASMISLFNVMFSETFSKDKAVLSASILAIAPLLAEFLAAPIQYLFTYNNVKEYSKIWLVSSILAFITLIFSFLIKEINLEKNSFTTKKILFVVKNKIFLFCCIIGLLLSFMKFSTTGSNMINYAKHNLDMQPFLIAYLDTVFSSFQLIASILIGTYFVNKIGLQKSLILSISLFSIFYVITIFNKNQYILFLTYSIIGFAYGGAYTSLISMALQYFDRDYRNISMGIFQFFFSFGIFYADRIYIYIINILGENKNVAIFEITLGVSLICLLILILNILYKRR